MALVSAMRRLEAAVALMHKTAVARASRVVDGGTAGTSLKVCTQLFGYATVESSVVRVAAVDDVVLPDAVASSRFLYWANADRIARCL